VIATGVDYLFKSAVATNVAKHDLPSFLARYNTIVNASALVFQLVLAPRLLQGLGVIAALSVLPGLLLLGSAASALIGGLVPRALPEGVRRDDAPFARSAPATRSSICRCRIGARALQGAHDQRRTTWRPGRRVDRHPRRPGLAGAPPAAIAAGLAVLAVVWLASLATLRTHYIGRFRQQLRVLSTGHPGLAAATRRPLARGAAQRARLD
jgi:hypothetical protein